MKSLIALGLAAGVFCAAPARAENVRASYYGAESGRMTASGQRFRPMGRTCAHRSYPFGTHLRVTYRGRSTVVTVTDRGPAAWTGRSIDLARGAAADIGMIAAGVATVNIQRLD